MPIKNLEKYVKSPKARERIEKMVEAVYADKGYVFLHNIRFVLSKGGMPYIAIRDNAKRGLRRRLLKLSKSPEWKKKYSQRRGKGPLSKPSESGSYGFPFQTHPLKGHCSFLNPPTILSGYGQLHLLPLYSASKLILFKVLAYDLYV